MVDVESDTPVDTADVRKAFEAEGGVYVVITPEEIEQAAPEPARDVRVSRFVPNSAIDRQMFDRPYYLGPGEHATTDYFALGKPLKAKTSRELSPGPCASIRTWEP